MAVVDVGKRSDALGDVRENNIQHCPLHVGTPNAAKAAMAANCWRAFCAILLVAASIPKQINLKVPWLRRQEPAQSLAR